MAVPAPIHLYYYHPKANDLPSSSFRTYDIMKNDFSDFLDFSKRSCFYCGRELLSTDTIELCPDCKARACSATPIFHTSPSHRQRPFEHYEFGFSEVPFKFLHHLGRGGAAVVDKVESSEAAYRGQCFARKTLIFTEDKADTIQREVSIHRYLQHDNVIPILFTYRAAIKERFHTRHLYAMLMPLADGNLAEFLEHWGNTPLCPEKASSMDTLICWPKQLADGLNYLHNHPSGTLVRHNDIKPSNLLLQGQTILYADFGLSRMFDLGEATTTYTPAVSFTKLYSAPEVLDGPRRRSSDIFSLGCVYSEILTVLLGITVAEAAKFRGSERNRGYAQQPNKTLHWLLRLLFRFYESEVSEIVDVDIKMCMVACLRMLEPQPNLRVTAKQLCQVRGWKSNRQDAPEPDNSILTQLGLQWIPAPDNLKIIRGILNRVMTPGFEVSWDDLHHSDNFLQGIWYYILPLGPDYFQIPILYS